MAMNKVRYETDDSIRKSRTCKEKKSYIMSRKQNQSLKPKKNFCDIK